MRIYTEVIFEWDDKQGKLVETSSKSFDYQGEVALADWKGGVTKYDAAGNEWYEKRWINAFKKVGEQKIYKNGVEVVGYDKNTDGAGAKSRFERYVNAEISDFQDTKLYDTEGEAQNAWSAEYQQDWMEDKATREKYQTGESKYLQEGAEGITAEAWQQLGDEEKNKWHLDTETGEYNLTSESYWSEEQVKEERISIAEGLIQGHIDDWLAITNPDEADEFQNMLRSAAEAVELQETDIQTEYEQFFDPDTGTLAGIGEAYQTNITRAGEAYTTDTGALLDKYTTDVERLTGEEGVYTTGVARATEQYAEDVKKLTGQAVYDDEGNLISEGTYTAGMRELGEGKAEAEEDIILSREEELDVLREEAVSTTREAEARIGAAGFAATGVGRTAREVLAEEIGEEARDIEAGITREREGIREGYLEDVGELEKGKTTALGEYEKTKTTALADFETGKTTALEDYLEAKEKGEATAETERDYDLADFLTQAEGAVTTAEAPWEAATKAYQKALTTYGTYDPLTGAATGDIADIQFLAEQKLEDIQRDIQASLAAARETGTTMEGWNPFATGGTFYDVGQKMGWQYMGAGFDPTAATGAFGETISQKMYQPLTEGLTGMMFTEDYETPFADIYGGLDKPWEG